MKLPRIDKSRIKREFWELKDVRLAERYLQKLIVKPGYFAKLCAHEGAHLYYARLIYPNAKPYAPYVKFHDGSFKPFEAGIDTNGINKRCDRDRLIAFVKGLQAGGLAEAVHLMQSGKTPAEIANEVGDQGDRDDYLEHCEAIRDVSPGLVFDNDEVWRTAQRCLLKDLQDLGIRAEIDKATNSVRTFLCGAMYPNTHPTAYANDGSSIC